MMTFCQVHAVKFSDAPPANLTTKIIIPLQAIANVPIDFAEFVQGEAFEQSRLRIGQRRQVQKIFQGRFVIHDACLQAKDVVEFGRVQRIKFFLRRKSLGDFFCDGGVVIYLPHVFVVGMIFFIETDAAQSHFKKFSAEKNFDRALFAVRQSPAAQV